MPKRARLKVAVLTMVRDDADFLKLWLAYYGGLFGVRSLYVVNHGDGAMVRNLAHDANVIALPDEHHPKFDARRWRLLNHVVQGLRIYHDVVIVGDVDELVAADPQVGTLPEVLARLPRVPVVTPFGLELVHRPNEEPMPFSQPLLSVRSHVRVAPLYAKPCIVKAPARLSRGGHYADCDRLTMPEGLYLFHLKHCDRPLFTATTDRRNQIAAATGVARPRDAMIGRHWFVEARDDRGTFEAIDRAPVVESFDMSGHVTHMAETWRAREGTEFWEFAAPHDPNLYRLPERFRALF